MTHPESDNFSVVCVNIPHDKHMSADTTDVLGDTADVLGDTADVLGDTAISSLTVPTGSQFRNTVSKSATADCF